MVIEQEDEMKHIREHNKTLQRDNDILEARLARRPSGNEGEEDVPEPAAKRPREEGEEEEDMHMPERPSKRSRLSSPPHMRPHILAWSGDRGACTVLWDPTTCKDEKIRELVSMYLHEGNQEVLDALEDNLDDKNSLPEALRGIPVEDWGKTEDVDACDVITLCTF